MSQLSYSSMNTSLQLLMRDGAITVSFSPRLTAEQYAELTKLVERPTTKAQLQRELERAAIVWKKAIQFGE